MQRESQSTALRLVTYMSPLNASKLPGGFAYILLFERVVIEGFNEQVHE